MFRNHISDKALNSRIHKKPLQLDNKKITLLNTGQGFLGGPGVKNPPANAGDMGSMPVPGRF